MAGLYPPNVPVETIAARLEAQVSLVTLSLEWQRHVLALGLLDQPEWDRLDRIRIRRMGEIAELLVARAA